MRPPLISCDHENSKDNMRWTSYKAAWETVIDIHQFGKSANNYKYLECVFEVIHDVIFVSSYSSSKF